MEYLVVGSPEDKADLLAAGQARLKYLSKVQSMRGWPVCMFRDKPVRFQIKAEKMGKGSDLISDEVLTAAGGSGAWSGVLQKLCAAYVPQNVSSELDGNFLVARGKEEHSRGRYVYIGSKNRIRFHNAVLGMGREFFCLYHLGWE